MAAIFDQDGLPLLDQNNLSLEDETSGAVLLDQNGLALEDQDGLVLEDQTVSGVAALLDQNSLPLEDQNGLPLEDQTAASVTALLDQDGLALEDQYGLPLEDEGSGGESGGGAAHPITAAGTSQTGGSAAIYARVPITSAGTKIRRLASNGSWVLVAELEDWQEINWNSAWGVMKRGTFRDQGTIPKDYAPTDNFGGFATLQFTPTAGRLYRFLLQIRAVGNADAVGDITGNFILTRNGDWVPAGGSGIDPWKRSAAQWDSWRIPFVYNTNVIGTTEATFGLYYSNGTTFTRMWFDPPSIFYVEDIGPERA